MRRTRLSPSHGMSGAWQTTGREGAKPGSDTNKKRCKSMKPAGVATDVRNLLESLLANGSRPRVRPSGYVARARMEAIGRVGDDAFAMRIHLPEGMEYTVEASNDLHSWTLVETGAAATGLVEFADAAAAGHPHRFYRAITGLMASVNVIGYVNLTVPPGLMMIANPFHSPNTGVSSLLSNVPDGLALHKFDVASQRLVQTILRRRRWSHPEETLSPGEGCILGNPTGCPFEVSFAGEVSQGTLCNPIPAGTCIRSSMVPQGGTLDAELEFPITEGDAIQVFDTVNQGYVIHRFVDGKWNPAPPAITVGEAFWVQKQNPANWIRNLFMN